MIFGATPAAAAMNPAQAWLASQGGTSSNCGTLYPRTPSGGRDEAAYLRCLADNPGGVVTVPGAAPVVIHEPPRFSWRGFAWVVGGLAVVGGGIALARRR